MNERIMSEREERGYSERAAKEAKNLGTYSEAELRRRLANEPNIMSFTTTIAWFLTNATERSRFEQLVFERIIIGAALYWPPKELGCPF